MSKLYEWLYDGDNISVKKIASVTDLNKLIGLFTREVKLRNIKLDSMAIAKWADGEILELEIGPKEKVDTSPKVEVTYNQKMTQAFLTTYPDIITGQIPSADLINSEINKQGITHGMIEVNLIKVRNIQERFTDELIAETKDAVNGKDAEIIYHVKAQGAVKPKILEDGSTDYYNTSVIENVTKNQVLIEKIPPTSGQPGITVKGKALHAMNGKNKKLPPGKNVEHSADGLKAYATIDGMLSMARNRISILPVFEVNGDVDFATGNIEFLGNVVVKGNLKNGFNIKSGGNVHIYGIVEGGSIEAEGSVFVQTGIRGLKKTRIISKGTVTTKFIENAFVRANLDILVDEAIMHSEIIAGNSVVLNKNKGLLVGGITRAALFIKCKNIGNSMATKTEVEMGVDPALKDEYIEVSARYEEVRDIIKKSKQGIKILQEVKQKTGELPLPKEKMLTDLLTNLKNAMDKEEELRAEVSEFSNKISELKDAFLDVEESLNPGVEVRIGEYTKRFSNPNYKVRVLLTHGDIVLSPLI